MQKCDHSQELITISSQWSLVNIISRFCHVVFLVMSSSKLSPHTIVFSVLDIMFSILA